MVYLWSTTLAVGVVLQVLLIAALLHGGGKRFKVLFAYSIVLLLTTVVEASAFYNRDFFNQATRYYWTIDASRQGLIFLLVISLIYTAMEHREKRASARRFLALGALVFAAFSLYFTRDPKVGFWMTEFSRNLGFLAVVLNLILWAVLIKYRSGDHILLLLSGGMGIQMTGKAIGHSLRQMSAHTVVAGNLIIVVSHLVCLYIWWQAFRHFDPKTAVNIE